MYFVKNIYNRCVEQNWRQILIMNKVEIGERIRQLRTERNLSRNSLANLSGVSPTYIAQLEEGLKSPTVEYLSYICDALNISLYVFFMNKQRENRINEALSKLTDEQQDLLINFIEKL